MIITIEKQNEVFPGVWIYRAFDRGRYIGNYMGSDLQDVKNAIEAYQQKTIKEIRHGNADNFDRGKKSRANNK